VNERCAGAIEALAWVLYLTGQTGDVGRVRRAVETVRDELLQGVAVDFRNRLTA
jgi:hypothetical protein